MDILSVLQKASYGPDAIATYNSIDVIKTIKDKIGQVEPELRCLKFRNTVVLFEVVLCLDVDGVTYIDCPTTNLDPVVLMCQNNRFQLPP